LLIAICQNLIDNAIKYSKNKETPLVNMSIISNSGGLIFKIEDNGIGIAPQYHGKIFEMFFRATEASSGAGLGLYIVSSAVNKLGGTISLESTPGIGSTFIVNLPH
jgi:signal transduction histidine kinase